MSKKSFLKHVVPLTLLCNFCYRVLNDTCPSMLYARPFIRKKIKIFSKLKSQSTNTKLMIRVQLQFFAFSLRHFRCICNIGKLVAIVSWINFSFKPNFQKLNETTQCYGILFAFDINGRRINNNNGWK